jgi:tetratricopeptide (TPR) repeat protein
MDRKGIVLVLVIGIISGFLCFNHGFAASTETTLTNFQEIDQQLLSLLKSKKYEELDSKIKAYLKSYEADPLRERYVSIAFEVFQRPLPDLEPLLNEWISKSPKSYAAYAARGIYYTSTGQTERGGQVISETTKKQLEGMDFYFNKAIKDLDKAYSLNPRLIHALYYKMGILAHYGERDQLRQLRDKGLAINPLSSVLRWMYITTLLPRWGGSIEKIQKEIESARPYYTKNPDLKALDGRILAEYGDQAFYFEKDYQKAIRFYNEALQHGDAPFYYSQRGTVYVYNNQFDLCIKDMDFVIQHHPNDPESYFYRGFSKHRLQRYNDAIADFTKSIDDNPHDPRPWINRGHAYNLLKKYDLALTDFEKAVALSPNNSDYLSARDAMKRRLQTKTK